MYKEKIKLKNKKIFQDLEMLAWDLQKYCSIHMEHHPIYSLHPSIVSFPKATKTILLGIYTKKMKRMLQETKSYTT